MKSEGIYHVLTMTIGNESEVNSLLKDGWELLDVVQYSSLDLAAGHPISYGQYIVGCTKEIYEKYKTETTNTTEDLPY